MEVINEASKYDCSNDKVIAVVYADCHSIFELS